MVEHPGVESQRAPVGPLEVYCRGGFYLNAESESGSAGQTVKGRESRFLVARLVGGDGWG